MTKAYIDNLEFSRTLVENDEDETDGYREELERNEQERLASHEDLIREGFEGVRSTREAIPEFEI